MKVLLSAIYPYIYLLLFFTIPFDDYVRALPNILLVVLVLAFPFVVKKEDFEKIKTNTVLIFTLFCLYLITNSYFNERLQEDFTVIKKVLLTVGLVVLYIPIQDFDKIKKAILFSSVAAIVFSVINIVILTNTINEFHFGSSPEVIEALLIDRLYLGFLSVLSILVSFNSLKPKFHPINRYYLVNIIVNVLFIFLIVSKISILLLVFLLLLRQMYGKQKKIRIPLLILAALTIIAIYFFGTTGIGSKKKPTALQNFITNTTTWEIRSITWECAVKAIENNPINWKGLGFYGTKDKLVSCYQESVQDTYKRNQFIAHRYNAHNQFLDFYLSSGIVGLLLFVILLLVLFIKNRNSFFYTALLVSLVMYCMVENVFHRQIGAYYIGFILIVLVSNKMVVQNKPIKEV
tara:strand:- start:3269 stop:4480 length:1212 start_codon:yes stop_codon:yes gene_type:complete